MSYSEGFFFFFNYFREREEEREERWKEGEGDRKVGREREKYRFVVPFIDALIGGFLYVP